VAETMGERVEAARKARGLSVADVALRVGKSESAIRHIENGTTREPGCYVFLKIARMLNADPFHLAFGGATAVEDATRSPEDPLQDFARLLMRTIAQGPPGNSSEDRVRDALRRIARE
jgi:transcriptional regulator with XRE-family HTH domain